MPVPHHSFFTGRMPFLPPNQQRQSTEVVDSASLDLSKSTPVLIHRNWTDFSPSILTLHTHPFNGLFSGTTWVSLYQKGKNQSGFYWSKRE